MSKTAARCICNYKFDLNLLKLLHLKIKNCVLARRGCIVTNHYMTSWRYYCNPVYFIYCTRIIIIYLVIFFK